MRYALFAGDHYYPAGGMDDLVGRFATLDEAKSVARMRYSYEAGKLTTVPDGADLDEYGKGYDWWHILDTETFEVINS